MKASMCDSRISIHYFTTHQNFYKTNNHSCPYLLLEYTCSAHCFAGNNLMLIKSAIKMKCSCSWVSLCLGTWCLIFWTWTQYYAHSFQWLAPSTWTYLLLSHKQILRYWAWLLTYPSSWLLQRMCVHVSLCLRMDSKRSNSSGWLLAGSL